MQRQRAVALAILGIHAIGWWVMQDRMHGFVPTVSRDTPSYLVAAADPFSMETLTGYRTLGYPLLVRAFGFDTMPMVHGLAFVAAVLVLTWALARLCGQPVTCALVTLPLWYLEIPDGPVNIVLTDHLGLSVEILTVAFLLRVASSDARSVDWILLGTLLAACYHIRPAALAMVGIVPVVWALVVRVMDPAAWWQRLRSHALRVVAICVVPLLVYCSARWALVGHFGLVSLGGINLIGVAGQLITEEDIAALPARHQSLAAFIRQALVTKPDYKDPLLGYHNPRVDAISEQMGFVIWQTAVPECQRRGMDPGKHPSQPLPETDAELSALSKAILLQVPVRYVVWCVKAARRAAIFGFGTPAFSGPLALCIMAAFLLPGRPRPELVRLLLVVFSVAVWFSLGHTAIFVMTQYPNARYVAPAWAFWPMVPMAAALLCLRLERV